MRAGHLPAAIPRVRRLLLLMASAAAVTAGAQELLLLGGATRERSLRETTHGWAVEYAQGLGENAYATLSWLNEGHVTAHHRDGHAAQLWGRASFLDRRLGAALGIGPYRYFDTEQAGLGASYANDHGWGVVYSAGLTWYADRRWLFHLRANRIDTRTGIDTTMLLAGVGYQLDAPSAPGPRPAAPALAGNTTRNEVALFHGRTILNSFESENSAATAFEYRRGLGPWVEWSAGWLNEGGNGVIRRNGATAQLWLVRPFLDHRLALAAGIGGYLAVNEETGTAGRRSDDDRVSGIATLTASWRLDSRWFARVSWNRVVTGYSRDTDVILMGVGLRF